MTAKKRIGLLFCLLMATVCSFACGRQKEVEVKSVKIGVPYEDSLSDLNDSTYKKWLEKESGLDIQFVFIPANYTQEYLKIMLSENNTGLDAVFFTKHYYMTEQDINAYGKKGALLSLNQWIDNDSLYLTEQIGCFEDYDLKKRMGDESGDIYWMPSMDTSKILNLNRALWINVGWLEKLQLSIPSTTQEFEQVLLAFSEAYPDRLPLISSWEEDSTNVCFFLMNSFALCDPSNGFFGVSEDRVYFPPKTTAWREGLSYCRDLYEKGALPEQNFTFTFQQMKGIANDPRDLVGAFCAKSMSQILSEQSPELLSRYLAVLPLKGPKKQGSVMAEVKQARPGGIILSSTAYGKELFLLMDLMCGSDAFLAGHYGEKGIDWDLAKVGDISIFGEPAVITITNKEWYQRGENTGMAVGPYIAPEQYVDGVSWMGYQINQGEYLDARAYKAYQRYEQKNPLTTLLLDQGDSQWTAALEEAELYTRQWMKAFITGAVDLHNDGVWQAYLQGYEAMNIEELEQGLQEAYNRREK